MSVKNIMRQLASNPTMADPGASGTITVTQSPVTCLLASAAAETRTLARPTKSGMILTLVMQTDGGNITLTVTGGYNENGDTTFSFTDPGQFVQFISGYESSGGTYYWRKFSDHMTGGNPNSTPGAGISGGAGTVFQTSVMKVGGIITTNILIDITGLNSAATDLDIIGVDGTGAAHMGQITAARNGTILGGTMRCLEVPTGGDPNIALYSANEATGVEDTLISALTETLIFDPNADWTIDMDRSITAMPPANDYLYLVQGDAVGTNATYTGGKFLITLYGYDA